MKKININKATAAYTREVAPAGLHIGIGSAVTDLGTQTSIFAGRPTIARKVQVTFELPELRNSQTGKPLKVAQIYTASLNEKAKLRQDTESWMGKAMSADDVAAFEFSWMLGRHCRLDVGQNVKGDNVYATVERILPVADATVLPEASNDPVMFSLDEPDLKVFAALSSGVQAMIQASPEWKKLPFANNWLAQYEADIAANEPAF